MDKFSKLIQKNSKEINSDNVGYCNFVRSISIWEAIKMYNIAITIFEKMSKSTKQAFLVIKDTPPLIQVLFYSSHT
jgi:hypothetical protein